MKTNANNLLCEFKILYRNSFPIKIYCPLSSAARPVPSIFSDKPMTKICLLHNITFPSKFRHTSLRMQDKLTALCKSAISTAVFIVTEKTNKNKT